MQKIDLNSIAKYLRYRCMNGNDIDLESFVVCKLFPWKMVPSGVLDQMVAKVGHSLALFIIKLFVKRSQ